MDFIKINIYDPLTNILVESYINPYKIVYIEHYRDEETERFYIHLDSMATATTDRDGYSQLVKILYGEEYDK